MNSKLFVKPTEFDPRSQESMKHHLSEMILKANNSRQRLDYSDHDNTNNSSQPETYEQRQRLERQSDAFGRLRGSMAQVTSSEPTKALPLSSDCETSARTNVTNVIEAFNTHIAAGLTFNCASERQSHD